jgi:hypothetical protein
MSSSFIVEILARKRAELDELERFVCSPAYERLLDEVRTFATRDPEPWLVDWLMAPAFGMGARPLDIAARRGGVDLLVDQLRRIVNGVCA